MMPTFKWYPMLGKPSPSERLAMTASGFGQVFSNQDFVISSKGLVLLATTNDLVDPKGVRGKLSPKSVPGWLRYLHAVTTSTSGSEFLRKTRYMNSGSYDNEWIIFDQKYYSQKDRKLHTGAVH